MKIKIGYDHCDKSYIAEISLEGDGLCRPKKAVRLTIDPEQSREALFRKACEAIDSVIIDLLEVKKDMAEVFAAERKPA